MAEDWLSVAVCVAIWVLGLYGLYGMGWLGYRWQQRPRRFKPVSPLKWE